MSLCAINDQNTKELMVIWDLGRRCTFACSYCPPHRKNNWSDTASLEELKNTADILERYSEIYNAHRNERFKVSASFTGGEPTVNPSFFPFLEYLEEKYPHWKRTLTTNGFYSDRKLKTVMANTQFTTVSYHCESTEPQKAQVRKNIQTMVDEGYPFKINIMFHERPEYYQECIDLAQWCDELGVKYSPRIIGDQGDIKKGLKNKTVHTYTPDQIEWMKRFWEAREAGSKYPAHDASNPEVNKKQTEEPEKKEEKTTKEKKIVGQKIGRPCCGNRQMDLLVDDEWTTGTFVKENNYQGWNCMVNWYFLYINQEIGKVWHHQTCQVNMNGEVGPICDLDGFNDYCDRLEQRFETGSMPFIRCPKTHCGCGLCVPKAKHDGLAREIYKQHAPSIVPEHMDRKEEFNDQTLKAAVYAFDEKNGNETI